MIYYHQNRVEEIFQKACKCLKVTGFTFRVMNRQAPVNTARSFKVAYTNLKTKLVAIDIFTPKKREPKSINSILRVIAHEIGHHQKKPFRQLYRGHFITRSHYPGFYKQVNKNVAKFKKDPVLGLYFT
ncbi:MAG: hypothetical protein WC460_03055 [Patescibacteria group bacterium]